jgi:hypothetical protein
VPTSADRGCHHTKSGYNRTVLSLEICKRHSCNSKAPNSRYLKPFPPLHQVIVPVSQFRTDMASLPVISELRRIKRFAVVFTPASSCLGSMSSILHRARTIRNSPLISGPTPLFRRISRSRLTRPTMPGNDFELVPPFPSRSFQNGGSRRYCSRLQRVVLICFPKYSHISFVSYKTCMNNKCINSSNKITVNEKGKVISVLN